MARTVVSILCDFSIESLAPWNYVWNQISHPPSCFSIHYYYCSVLMLLSSSFVVAYKIDLPRKLGVIFASCYLTLQISVVKSVSEPLFLSLLFSPFISLPILFHAFIIPYLGCWIILLISNILHCLIHLPPEIFLKQNFYYIVFLSLSFWTFINACGTLPKFLAWDSKLCYSLMTKLHPYLEKLNKQRWAVL